MKKKGEVAVCDREQHARGLCKNHYKRLLRGGDPPTPSRQRQSVEERFISKLALPDPVTGCVEWTGHRTKDGYGKLSRSGIEVYTHRYSWERKHGPIPKGLHVLHKCDNPPCCNEYHLFLGTQTDNAADREIKGRGNQPKGEKHGRAKLTEANVKEIRRRLAAGEVQRMIAKGFGIAHSTVGKISRGNAWK